MYKTSLLPLLCTSRDGESAQLYADGVLVWSQVLSTTTGVSLCGGTYVEYRVMAVVDLGWMYKDSVVLEWTTTLNEGSDNEAWGLMVCATMDLVEIRAGTV